jgi:Glycine zipper
MKRMMPLVAMPMLALVVAGAGCSPSEHAAAADSSLARDLALAAHQRDSLDSISAIESRRYASPPKASFRSDDDPPYGNRTPSAGAVSRAVGAKPATSGEKLEKHTQRDAVIGAATGAVIGAVASHSKVKGGLMGAAVGGIVGAVIGNNVDKTKKP